MRLQALVLRVAVPAEELLLAGLAFGSHIFYVLLPRMATTLLRQIRRNHHHRVYSRMHATSDGSFSVVSRRFSLIKDGLTLKHIPSSSEEIYWILQMFTLFFSRRGFEGFVQNIAHFLQYCYGILRAGTFTHFAEMSKHTCKIDYVSPPSLKS